MQRSDFSALIRCIFIPTFLLFSLTTLAQAHYKNPSYDSIPITPKTWQEVDLSYHDIIHGKSYPASIQLLRPIAWLKNHGMHKVGNKVTFSIPEFGINAIHAQVTAIKPTTLNTGNVDWSKRDTRPVIGKFKRYAPVVKTYTFKNLATGKISTIHATPNHPFYLQNKRAFVPIKNVLPTDKLVSASGQQIKLVCLPNQTKHCGRQYNNSKPVPVYNLEVYRKHIYFVGDATILVHNMCDNQAATKIQSLWRGYYERKYKIPAFKALNDTRENIFISNTGLDENQTIKPFTWRVKDYKQNGMDIDRASYMVDRMRSTPYDNMGQYLRKITLCNTGNCAEQAYYISRSLKEEGLNSVIVEIQTGFGDSHHFSVMLNQFNKPIYILDPWRGDMFSWEDRFIYYPESQITISQNNQWL